MEPLIPRFQPVGASREPTVAFICGARLGLGTFPTLSLPVPPAGHPLLLLEGMVAGYAANGRRTVVHYWCTPTGTVQWQLLEGRQEGSS